MIWLWDIAINELQQTLEGYIYAVISVAFSPDSKIIVSGSDNRMIRLRDIAIGELQQILEGYTNLV
jgi:WD40 repeat protein